MQKRLLTNEPDKRKDKSRLIRRYGARKMSSTEIERRRTVAVVDEYYNIFSFSRELDIAFFVGTFYLLSK
jgi:hypothetical protein